jgi:hypothetical protein
MAPAPNSHMLQGEERAGKNAGDAESSRKFTKPFDSVAAKQPTAGVLPGLKRTASSVQMSIRPFGSWDSVTSMSF